MKYFTKEWGGGAFCLSLLLILFAIPAKGQQTFYAAVGGSNSSTCVVSTDPCPVELANQLLGQSAGNTLLLEVRREGGTVTISEDITFPNQTFTIGVFARRTDGAKKGTINFTGSVTISGPVTPINEITLPRLPKVTIHKDATVQFTNIKLNGAAIINHLTTARDLKIDRGSGLNNDNTLSILVTDTLIVNAGHTITLNKHANLRVRLSRGYGQVASNAVSGKLEVKGTIKGDGNVLIAHTVDYERHGADNRGDTTDDLVLHKSKDYTPEGGKITAADCLMLTGGGMIHSTLIAVAAGNVCVNLKEIGDLIAVGSVTNDAEEDSITTDIIFRDPVTAKGDIVQWSDAKVVFEKDVTIEGDVIPSDGVLQNGSNTDPSPQVTPALPSLGGRFGGVNIKSSYERNLDVGMHDYEVFGIDFKGASNTIEGDLRVDFITEDDHQHRVRFLADTDTDSGKEFMTTVEGDVLIEKEGDIHLQGHNNATKSKITTHNLSIEGEIFVDDGDPVIMMDVRTKSHLSDGNLCSTAGLTAGNKVMLSNDVILASGTTLTAQTVVVEDDVEVEGGSLITETVHVADGELVSEGTVQIGNVFPGELVLQDKGIEGTLATDSEVQYLAYATGSSDEVALGASINTLSVAVPAGRELRISNPITVQSLGLCRGTLVLIEPDDAKKKTIKVTEHIHVDTGRIALDSNSPGSIETDKSTRPAAADGYILTYVTAGEHTVSEEWFAPRDVVINHKDAVIINDSKTAVSIPGKLDIKKGHLHLKGADLTVGNRSTVAAAGRMLNIDNGELHTNGKNLMVHGHISVAEQAKEAGKILTGGGELHVLGQNAGKNLSNDTAVAIIGAGGTIDVGDGTLQLGPETTNSRSGLSGDYTYPIVDTGARPHVKLDVNAKGTFTGEIRVPKGSKQTEIIGKEFSTIIFDGAKNQPATNDEGTLYLVGIETPTAMTVDSLSAANGAVEFRANKVTVTKDVAVSSVSLYQEGKDLEFKGDLAITGTGGFSSRGGGADDKRMVMIGGDFSQVTTKKGAVNMHHPEGATYLSAGTDMTVMGDFKASGTGDASRFGSDIMTDLHLKKGFDFGLTTKGYVLNANLEFSGKEKQSVSTAAIDLHHVEINGAGIMLESDVSQAGGATLTLSKGHIGGDGFVWTVKNMNIEKGLVGRLNAAEGNRCGEDGDEACAPHAIRKGSRNSLISASSGRHVMYGNDGGGAAQGGYLFPLGMMKESATYYRPIILQLPVDLSDPTAVTASLMSIPAGATPVWPSGGLLVQGDGGNMLTLDVYSPDLFWKVDLGKGDPLPTNLNVRVAAHGIVNVFDSKGLRVVQWACDWTNPRLAGRYDAAEAGTFAVNGYVGGVLNITQSAVDVETCSIFGIAANGIENPIHQESFDSGIARIQLIHNAKLPAPVNVSLDGVELLSNWGFQSATGYQRVAAGAHTAELQLVGSPADQAIKLDLPALANGKSYALVAHGNLANLKTKVLETRLTSLASAKVDVLLVHGSADLGTVRLQTIDILADPRTANPTKLLASGFGFDAASPYRQLDPDFHRIEVISGSDKVGVFDVDLSAYTGQTLILNLSDMKANLSLYGVDINGATVSAVMVTGTESDIAELPTEFALHGNYPNPFNPSTRIQFDLPESAQVTVQIVDMLGREVMALPAKEFEAGANRSIELNATNLASGTYLYRMIATGAESRYVKSGRMTLVK